MQWIQLHLFNAAHIEDVAQNSEIVNRRIENRIDYFLESDSVRVSGKERNKGRSNALEDANTEGYRSE